MTAVSRRNALTDQVIQLCDFTADTAEIDAAVVTLCYLAGGQLNEMRPAKTTKILLAPLIFLQCSM